MLQALSYVLSSLFSYALHAAKLRINPNNTQMKKLESSLLIKNIFYDLLRVITGKS